MTSTTRTLRSIAALVVLAVALVAGLAAAHSLHATPGDQTISTNSVLLPAHSKRECRTAAPTARPTIVLVAIRPACSRTTSMRFA
jgi:hypothetical protein